MGNNRLGLQQIPFFLLLALTLFVIQGCGHDDPFKGFVKTDSPYQGGSYQPSLDLWTREARIYKGFDLELMVSATYKSADFRRAYVGEYARVFKLNETDRKRLEQDEILAAENHNEFLIASFMPESRVNDFDKKNPTWRLYLVMDEAIRLEPAKIEKKKMDPVIQYFFPYTSPWKSIYAVRFQKSEPKDKTVPGTGAAKIKLIITGVRGNAELKWDLN